MKMLEKKKKKQRELPTAAEIKAELKRVRHRRRYQTVLRSTLFTLITVAAIAILVATLWMPVLQIYGTSMTPTLEEGQIVVSLKVSHFEPGDIIAFHYNSNKILIKRYIAGPGDWVNIDADGTVYVNDVPLNEPYISQKSLGTCDIELPYQVPEARIFVMGDRRESSVDSRSTSIGCIAEEQIVGKIVFCIWPTEKFGAIR